MERIDYSEDLEYDPSAQCELTEAPSEKELIKAPFLENQYKLFHKTKAKFKIVAKGRRFGFTRGLALYVMERGMKGSESILWVDTSYSNITRYIERYFLPVLKQYPREYWEWKKTRSEMKIYGNNTETVIDFRSADRPENIEGFGFKDEKSDLFIMPKGKAEFVNASDVFSSRRMQNIISSLKSTFDYVIIDSPPIMAVSDARLIAKLVDKTVFVVHWDKTPRKVIKAAVHQLKESNSDIAGCVLQQVNLKRYGKYGYGDSGHYYHYGRYGHYYTS